MKFDIRKVKKILQCAEEVPFYRDFYRSKGINTNKIFSYDDFCMLPILDKMTYRNNLSKFIPDKFADKIDGNILENGTFFEIDNMLSAINCNMVITSGSTGMPLKVIHSDADDHRAYSVINNFRKKYLGKELGKKYLWVLPMNDKTKQYFYDENVTYINKKYGIDYFLANYSEKNFDKLYQLLMEEKPHWISCSPSMIFEFSNYLQSINEKYHFSYIELHSEPLYDWQYIKIKECFGGVVKSIYSSNEVNFIGAMCPEGCYHIFTDNVFVELLDTDVSNTQKKVVVTSLSYYDFPMIRYELGDLAKEQKCCDNINSINLCKFRDADMILSISGELCEPYIVFDSIVFLCDKYKVCINKYTIIQRKVDLFEYYFDEGISIGKDELKMFLQHFLTVALGYCIIVVIKSLNINIFNKYRRFICKL